MSQVLFDYVVALADDALLTAQRLGEWVAAAPQLEEDVALTNIGLDQLGQARALLTLAGEIEEAGRTEDDLAYFRDAAEFRNVQLVERGYGEHGWPDFGVAIARLLLLSAYQLELYSRLTGSTEATLAAIAAKAVKEVDYHFDHARLWTLRLGDGTEESHRRLQAALEEEWRFAEELFDDTHVHPSLLATGVAVAPGTLRGPWERRVLPVLADATLTRPEVPPARTGGRHGVHTEQLGHVLAEMQHLARAHSGAQW